MQELINRGVSLAEGPPWQGNWNDANDTSVVVAIWPQLSSPRALLCVCRKSERGSN